MAIQLEVYKPHTNTVETDYGAVDVLKSAKAADGSLELLFQVGTLSYPVVLARSLGPGIVNPPIETVGRMLDGFETPVNESRRHSIILPLQGDGRCAADCHDCVFASSRNVGKIAKPVDPKTMGSLIDASFIVGEQRGVLAPNEHVGVAPLMSGEPSFNVHMKDLLRMIGDNPRIPHSRFSTIAVRAINHPLQSFLDAAMDFEERGVDHTMRPQVSLHSFDHNKRSDYVSSSRTDHPLDLIPPEEIAEYFAKYKRITGVTSTLAFVVDTTTQVDMDALHKLFDRNTTAVSVRQKIPLPGETTDPVGDRQRLLEIYADLERENWTRLVIPAIGGNLEQNNL